VKDDKKQIKPPSYILTALEIRSIYELLIFQSTKYIYRFSKKGDGHPVVVFPGYLMHDIVTAPMRSVMNKRGYKAYPLGIGINFGFYKGLDEDIIDRVLKIYNENGEQPITGVGWSLGGVFLREIAKIIPHVFRNVITLGSPFAEDFEYTSLWKIYNAVAWIRKKIFRKKCYLIHEMDEKIIKSLREPLTEVPSTSIYSSYEGVVAKECSIQISNGIAENIDMKLSSHCGLISNPMVMWVILDRLTQNKENWKPYECPKYLKTVICKDYYVPSTI
jgi:pimeloyl-ACP methyl ester carboxylesterase